MRASINILFSAVLVVGCAVTQPPAELSAPAPGYAKLYVIRPAFSEVGKKDTPTFYINDRKAAPLAYESYSEFTLKPGAYKLSVKPEGTAASIWSGDWTIALEPDRTYCVAIWNDVEHRSETRIFPLVPWAPYLATVSSSTSLRFEVVAEKDALPVVQTLTHVRSLTRDFAPLP